MGFIAGSIVHELRQPLSTIQMIASYLKATVHPAEGVSKNLEMLEQQAEMAGTILSSLVSFGRSGNREVSRRCAPDFGGILRRAPPQPEISVERKLDRKLPLAMADPLHVDRIISNLVDNGIESLDGRGTIFISTRSERETVLLEIADTGCGIQQDYGDRIFEPS